jgi:hypothetical protein
VQDLLVGAGWIAIVWGFLSLFLSVCFGAALRYCAVGPAEETRLAGMETDAGSSELLAELAPVRRLA